MTADPGRSGGQGTGWTLPKGEKPDDLRWYATHEALSRHSIFDVLQWLADTMETHALLDPVTARDTIEWLAAEHHWEGGYYCSCGHELNSPHGFTLHVAEACLAALASQERGE